MFDKFPKDDSAVRWTSHVKRKMLFYGLSGQRIRSILRNYERKEDGIAPQTVAVMSRNDKPKRKEEIWVMYGQNAKLKNQNEKAQPSKNFRIEPKKIIISAWRYPGISKKKDGVPVPDDVLEELNRFLGV